MLCFPFYDECQLVLFDIISFEYYIVDAIQKTGAKCMKLVKRGNYYYMRLRRGGIEEWVSTHKTSEREAKKAAERILMVFDREKHMRQLSRQLCNYAMALAKGEISLRELSSPLAMLEKQAMQEALEAINDIFPLPALTASDLWDRYIEVSGKVKKSTLSTKKQRWDKFAAWAGDMDMRTLNEIICRQFLDSLGVSSQTRKNYVSDLSSVFNVSDIENPWSSNLRQCNDASEPKERAPISIESVRGVLKYCDSNPGKLIRGIPLSRWGQFLRTLYYTGLRPVDVCHLRRDEIKAGVIELLPEKTSRTRRKVSYKADPKLLMVLQSIPDDGTPLFFSEFAIDYDKNRTNLACGFRSIIASVGIKEESISLYGFRHNYVTFQINSGNSDEAVASAVGHTSTNTTNEHYYHGRRNVELTDMPEV